MMNKYEKAKFILLVYSLKYQWVKELAMMNDIDLSFGFSNKCDESLIMDCIDTIKQEKNPLNKTIEFLKEEMNQTESLIKKVEIAQQILEIKKMMVKLW